MHAPQVKFYMYPVEQNSLNPRRDRREENGTHITYDYVIISPTHHGLLGLCLLKDKTLLFSRHDVIERKQRSLFFFFSLKKKEKKRNLSESDSLRPICFVIPLAIFKTGLLC